MSQRLRIACWNICWFAGLFDQDDALIDDDSRSALHDVTKQRQAEAIAHVLRAVDADLFAIIEAPNDGKRQSTVRALQGFAEMADLRQTRAVIGFPSDTEQEIALLYDPDQISAWHDPVGDPTPEADELLAVPSVPRFDGVFPLDLDGDGEADLHRFSKPPLEAQVHLRGPDKRLRLIVVHAKSKAPHGAKSEAEATRISLLNRRKQLAQCAWLRGRVDEHLQAGDDLVILGDFNDGPGLDKYERVFGRSGVEVVMGDPGRPEALLRNPFTRRQVTRFGALPSTARFYIRQTQGYLNALIDFVMLSPRLAANTAPYWRIWHPFDDAVCFADDAMREALLDASDHFPVSVDLHFG
ncbi:MAG: endonuclease/exonuclease/phosphatase family protein [Pseudomonadota bacterium]